MKRFVVFAIVLGFLLPAMASAPGGISGKWSGSISIQNNAGETQSQPVFLILKQDESTLTGTGGPSEEEQNFQLSNGKVDGDKATFEVKTDDATYKSSVQFSADEITGQTVREGLDGIKIPFKVALKRVADKPAK